MPRAVRPSSWVGDDELVCEGRMGVTQSRSWGRPAAYKPSMRRSRSTSLLNV